MIINAVQHYFEYTSNLPYLDMKVGAKDVVDDLVLNEPVGQLTPAAGSGTTQPSIVTLLNVSYFHHRVIQYVITI